MFGLLMLGIVAVGIYVLSISERTPESKQQQTISARDQMSKSTVPTTIVKHRPLAPRGKLPPPMPKGITKMRITEVKDIDAVKEFTEKMKRMGIM